MNYIIALSYPLGSKQYINHAAVGRLRFGSFDFHEPVVTTQLSKLNLKYLRITEAWGCDVSRGGYHFTRRLI